MGRMIGIDLGTTNSLASFWDHGEMRLIPNSLGEYLTPSVVSIEDDGTAYVGKIAKERLITHPDRTVSIFKRSMGTDKTYKIKGKYYRPEELSAFVLKKLKEDAEYYLGETVDEAIVSVPAYFGDIARRATRDAGRIAGLKVDRIVNEPSAAALACQQIRPRKEARFLVYDFGGGTLDVSLVDCFSNVVEITAVSGNNRLGGRDFDRILAEYFCMKHGLTYEEQAKSRKELLLRSAETAKRELSVKEEVTMRVSGNGLEGSVSVTREDLVRICGGIFRKMYEPVKKVLQDGNMSVKDLSGVIMVGGSCKMPVVQQYMRYRMPGCSIIAMEPDYMVALGVSAFAGIMERKSDIRDMVLLDICPFSLGTAVINRSDKNKPYMDFIIERNSPLPISKTKCYSSAYDNQEKLNIEVYQGESFYAKDNILLGNIEIGIPKAPAGAEGVDVTYRYDINGLLVVDLQVLSTGKKSQLIFVDGKAAKPDESILKQIKMLEKQWTAPKDEEENKLLLARAQRVLIQLTGQERFLLQTQIKLFEKHLSKGRDKNLQTTKENLIDLLNGFEAAHVWEEQEADPDNFLKWIEADQKNKVVQLKTWEIDPEELSDDES